MHLIVSGRNFFITQIFLLKLTVTLEALCEFLDPPWAKGSLSISNSTVIGRD